MNHYTWVIPSLLIPLVLLSACEKQQEIIQVEEVRPVKTMLIQANNLNGVRNFPGRIDANKKVELAFRVSGKVQELLVKEGDKVALGQVIARLDPTDFKITADNKKALFVRTEKDYKRGKKLVKEGHISRRDFDKLEADFLSAQADLKLAEQQLSYTELKAPFKGIVARRHIQNFEEIQVQQTIISLNDNSILEVKFDIPENLLLKLRRNEGADPDDQSQPSDNIPVKAIFQGNKEYKLNFKEISTKANEKTQTFMATYTMPDPDDIHILPGMTTTVNINLSEYMNHNDKNIYLPVSAVVADIDLKGLVWVVDEQNMTVKPVSVKVGTMRGNTIKITDGLEKGQRVVTAGVPFLYKGLKVSLIKMTEQAEDNQTHQRPQMKADITEAAEKG